MLRSSRVFPCALVAVVGLVGFGFGCGGPDGGADAGIDAGPDASTPEEATYGPKLVVSPESAVSFGLVPWFEDAPPQPRTRTITIFNQGAAGPDTDGVLKITGATVEAAAAGTEASALTAELSPTCDAEVGLLPRAGENVVEVKLTFTAGSIGQKKWRVTIDSNDPERPQATVEILAEVVDPPPCQFEVTPTEFNFGLLSPPDYRDVAVTFQNVGTTPAEACFLSNVRLAEGSAPFVSLPGAAFEPRVIGAGGATEILVRVSFVAPLPTEPSVATLALELANAATPEVSVPLRFLAPMPTTCLTIAPTELDFGTVRGGCESPERSIVVYNTCATTVTIKSVRMQDAAGQPAGGPDCEGTAPCPEFIFTQAPPIPQGGLTFPPGGSGLSFHVRYRPIDVGSDVGALAVDYGNGDTDFTGVVALSAVGDPQTRRTDVFIQDADPEADVLLVIDESPAMAAHQASVASNLNDFFQYLASTPFDFHLGVVSADPDAGVALRTGPTHPDAFLTPTTPDAGVEFAEKIDLGTGGTGAPQCLAQAVGALTAPQNAGFVRPDAALGVVCISASTDDSPLLVTNYVSDLQAIHPSSASRVSFNAIAGFDPVNCPGDSGRLADAVAATNGVKDNICAPDWHTSLENYAYVGWGQRSVFYLSDFPDLSAGPLSITVDGQAVSSTTTSGETIWTYDVTQNAVTFAPDYVPTAGQTIEVSYWTTCHP